MKILLTGAVDFIKRLLTKTLANEYQHVVASDCSLPDSCGTSVKPSNAAEVDR